MMHTYSGKAVVLEALTVDMIEIEDIAHALSHLCRYNGHTRFHYSVAQHCCYVASFVENNAYKLAALLHDAPEAYIGDVTHDLKNSPEMRGYKTIEYRVERVIARKFGLNSEDFDLPEIKTIDRRLAVTEKAQLFNYPIVWDHPEYQVPPVAVTISEWTPYEAKIQFMNMFKRYAK